MPIKAYEVVIFFLLARRSSNSILISLQPWKRASSSILARLRSSPWRKRKLKIERHSTRNTTYGACCRLTDKAYGGTNISFPSSELLVASNRGAFLRATTEDFSNGLRCVLVFAGTLQSECEQEFLQNHIFFPVQLSPERRRMEVYSCFANGIVVWQNDSTRGIHQSLSQEVSPMMVQKKTKSTRN